VEQEQPARHDHQHPAAVTLGGMYAAFSGWMYLAWYRHHNSTGFSGAATVGSAIGRTPAAPTSSVTRGRR